MEAIIQQFVKELPAVGAVIVTVVLFLRFLREERAARVKIHEDNHRVIEKNTEVVGQCIECLHRMNGYHTKGE